MSNITIFLGSILIALGVGTYAVSETKSPTAFIPSAVGLCLLILGFLARKDSLRKHVMHAAVLIGLLGCLGAAFRAISATQKENFSVNLAFLSQVTMALICAVFVVLCIRSFVEARRSRAMKSE